MIKIFRMIVNATKTVGDILKDSTENHVSLRSTLLSTMNVVVCILTELHTTQLDLNAALMIVSDNLVRAKCTILPVFGCVLICSLIDYTTTTP